MRGKAYGGSLFVLLSRHMEVVSLSFSQGEVSPVFLLVLLYGGSLLSFEKEGSLFGTLRYMGVFLLSARLLTMRINFTLLA